MRGFEITPISDGDGTLAGRVGVAGVDEAGRGPLAGPVVAAAVILDPSRPITGLRDSKLLSARRRRELAHEIRRHAAAFAVALATPEEIDRLNVLQASLLAMRRAVLALAVVPERLQIDGPHAPGFGAGGPQCPIDRIIGGDSSVPAISAASILAKVYRDRLMCRWHLRHPLYGFDRHKGYPTAAHIEALRRYGPCAIHRMSFAPVALLGSAEPRHAASV